MRRLFEASAALRAPEHARCELCAAPLAPRHDHLYAVAARTLRCACLGCAVIVPSSSHSGLRRVPRTCRRLDPAGFAARLDGAGVPVGVAIAIRRDDGRLVVSYPGPAGLIESGVAAEIDLGVGLGAALEPEVEALIWSSLDGEQLWRAGIDVVYALIGELRRRRSIADAPRIVARVLAEAA